MEARVRWLDNASFVAETGSGHALVIDGPPSIGGRNIGPRPMELMLLGVGSCSSVDVLHILKRARQNVVDCDCKLSAERDVPDRKPKAERYKRSEGEDHDECDRLRRDEAIIRPRRRRNGAPIWGMSPRRSAVRVI